MLNPLPGYVVASPDEGMNKTASGLLLQVPEKQLAQANIVSVGDDVPELKAGDKIIYKPYSSTETELDGKNYLIIDHLDILAVVNE